MSRIAVVILSTGEAKGVLPSLESVAIQNIRSSLEIIIATHDETRLAPESFRLLENSPWISNWRTVCKPKEKLFAETGRISSAEYFLLMQMGDVLKPNAVQLLLDSLLGSNAAVCRAAKRWTNGEISWSDPSVDELFESDKFNEYNLDFHSLVSDPSAISMVNRSLLLALSTDRLATASVAHEYIGKSWCDGLPGALDVYQNREARSYFSDDLDAAPFPKAKRRQLSSENGCWLFGERGGESAEDNGLALFQYCMDNVPDVACFYVLNEGVSCPSLSDYKSNVIYKNTEAWKENLARASHFFFTDSAADILIASNDVNQFPDVTYVYLTHGCLAYSPGVYQKAHQYIDYVTVTNRQDIESASREWGFPASRFLLTGLARWDRLASKAGKRKEILICPTWRKSFNSSNWSSEDDIEKNDVDTFKESDFFNYLKSFLQSNELLALLNREELHVTVNLHFRFQKYLSIFNELASDRIRVATPENETRNLREMMEGSVALITDYSSIMWDMGFMEKPVICYQFDKPAMLAERKKEQFSITDDQLFAKVCYSQSTLMDALNEIVLQGFRIDDQQLAKLSKFIPHRDQLNCERIYQAVASVDRLPVTPSVKSSYSINSNEQIEKALGQLDDASRVAVIADADVSAYPNAYALEPDTWNDILSEETFDTVIVQLHLNARNCWAPVFFDPQRTREFLDRLLVFCGSKNIQTVFCQSSTFIYEDRLNSVTRKFDKTLRSSQVKQQVIIYDVSVIIPAFNSEPYVSKTVDSVLAQKFAGTIEIIVVNDGSTDGTQELIDQYTEKYSYILGIRQVNSRQGVARNNALLLARGEYVMFLDADDMLPANSVAELYQTLKYNETKIATGLVASSSVSGDDQRINQAYYQYTKAPKTFVADAWPHAFYDPSCAGKMYERKFLLELNLFFPQSFHEDQVFMFGLFSRSERIAVTKSVVYLYITHPETTGKSGTQIFSNNKFREMLLAGILAESIVRQSGLPNRVIDYALGFLILRYDRFLWKQNASADWKSDASQNEEVMSLLQRFLQDIPDELIWKNARYCPVFLLLTKRSLHDCAANLRVDERANELYEMIKAGELPDDILDGLSMAPERVSKYNYYRAVPIGKLEDNADIVTEQSYVYRLGAIFVEVAKSPSKTLLMPWHLTALMYDMVTRKGRAKENDRKEAILQSSSQALINHSAFIKTTASYQLGVTIVESFTGSPKSVLELPAKIKQIYSQHS